MNGFLLGALLFSGSSNVNIQNMGGSQFIEVYGDIECKTPYLINAGYVAMLRPDRRTAGLTHIKLSTGSNFYICKSYSSILERAKELQKKLDKKGVK